MPALQISRQSESSAGIQLQIQLHRIKVVLAAVVHEPDLVLSHVEQRENDLAGATALPSLLYLHAAVFGRRHHPENDARVANAEFAVVQHHVHVVRREQRVAALGHAQRVERHDFQVDGQRGFGEDFVAGHVVGFDAQRLLALAAKRVDPVLVAARTWHARFVPRARKVPNAVWKDAQGDARLGDAYLFAINLRISTRNGADLNL